MPFCHEWDEAKTLPKSLFTKAAAAGWLPLCVGTWPTKYVGEPPAELRGHDYLCVPGGEGSRLAP